MTGYVHIDVMEPVVEYTRTVSPDTYTLTPERGWVWVQRVAIWVLKKLRCNVVNSVVSTHMVAINETDLLEKARGQLAGLRRLNIEPDFIIYGAAQDAEFRQMISPMEYTSYHEGRLHVGRDEWPALYGVNVRVIPWFDGVLVVPKGK